jgi:hypothetical protein
MNTNNNNEINNNKKGSTKGTKIDGKYIPSKEQKSQYLQTYKNKPCYNLLLKCPLCDAQYIKANEEKHNKSKKHLFNKKCYDEAIIYINNNNINDDNEQLKIFSEIKSNNLYNQYLEKMKISKPSYFQNIKLFESLKI